MNPERDSAHPMRWQAVTWRIFLPMLMAFVLLIGLHSALNARAATDNEMRDDPSQQAQPAALRKTTAIPAITEEPPDLPPAAEGQVTHTLPTPAPPIHPVEPVIENAEADLVIRQIHKSKEAYFAQGELVTFTVIITNESSVTATGKIVVDDTITPTNYLQPSFVFPQITASEWITTDLQDGTIRATYSNTAGLPPSKTITFDLQGTISDEAAPRITNTVTVFDKNPNGNTNAHVVNIISADVSVTGKVSPANSNPGAVVTYSITVANNGPSSSDVIDITDTLPVELEYISADPPPSSINPYLRWYITDIGVKDSTNLTITARVKSGIAAKTVTNIAQRDSNRLYSLYDWDHTNDIARTSLKINPGPDLALSKTASPSSLMIDDRITFTLKIDNLGTVTATNLVVTDTLPYTTSVSEVLTNRQMIESSLVPTNSTFIFTGSPTRGVWQVPSLAPKATAQVQFTALVSSVSVLRNATFTNTIGLEPTSPPDPNPNNDKDFVKFTTDLIRVSGKVLWNSSEARVIPGATVVLTDTAKHTYTTTTDINGYYVFNSTTTPIAAGRVGLKAIATGYRMDIAPNVIIATTTLGFLTQVDINMVDAPELGITKIASVSSAAPLDSVAYTITVANTGRMPAYYVVVTDTFPTGLTYESDTLTPSTGAITRTVPQTTGPTKIIWAFSALGAGESVSFRMNTTVVAGYTANATIKNTVDVGTITTEGVTTNNSASASFTVKAVAAPRISKTGTPDQAKLNEYFTFVITVKNIGNQDATTLVVEDGFPSFVDLSVSISYSSGVTPVPTNQTSGRDVKVSITKIPANGYVTITIRATVNSNLLDNRILTTNVAYLTWGTTKLESNSVSYTAYRTSLPDTGGWPDWAGDPPVIDVPARPVASDGLVNAAIIIASLLILCGIAALIYGMTARQRNPSWAGWFVRTGLILSAAALVFGLGAWGLARLSNPEQPSGVAQPVATQQVAQAPIPSSTPNVKTIPTVPNLPVEEQYWLLPPNPEEPQTLPDYPIPTPTALPTPSAPNSPLPDASPVTWIEIPAAQVNTVVKYVPYDGLTWKIGGLKQEVAWMGSTSWPGLGGNTALAGHVTLSSGGYGPFRYLTNLKPDDTITLYTEKNVYTYHVRSLEVLPGYELGPAYPTDQPQLTLITCTDWNKDEKRYTQRVVVYSDLVAVQPYTQPKRGN